MSSSNEKTGIPKPKAGEVKAVYDALFKQHRVIGTFRPLAIGIRQQLLAAHPDLGEAMIGAVLVKHTVRPRYLEAIARGGRRYNLDGTWSEKVSHDDADYADRLYRASPIPLLELRRSTEPIGMDRREQSRKARKRQRHKIKAKRRERESRRATSRMVPSRDENSSSSPYVRPVTMPAADVDYRTQGSSDGDARQHEVEVRVVKRRRLE